MSLLEKVKAQVEALPIPFIYHDLLRANNILNKTEVPACIVLINPDSELRNIEGNICEQTDFLFFFVDKTDFKLTSFENAAIIDRMKKIALRFWRNVRNSSDLAVVNTRFQWKKVYDYLDLNVTGGGLQLTLMERKGDCPNE